MLLRVTTIGVLVVLIGACSMGRRFSTPDPSWTRINSADLPARVEAIVFDTGSELRPDRSMSWGAWTVSFVPATIAERTQNDSTARNVVVKPLKCANAVAGERECGMAMSKSTDGDITCWIWGPP